MTKRWCVKSKGERWCATTDGLEPRQGTTSVPVACGHYVIMPGGIERRAPTCPDCIAALKARKPTKRKAGATP